MYYPPPQTHWLVGYRAPRGGSGSTLERSYVIESATQCTDLDHLIE
jgi:hypothetical protein